MKSVGFLQELLKKSFQIQYWKISPGPLLKMLNKLSFLPLNYVRFSFMHYTKCLYRGSWRISFCNCPKSWFRKVKVILKDLLVNIQENYLREFLDAFLENILKKLLYASLEKLKQLLKELLEKFLSWRILTQNFVEIAEEYPEEILEVFWQEHLKMFPMLIPISLLKEFLTKYLVESLQKLLMEFVEE